MWRTNTDKQTSKVSDLLDKTYLDDWKCGPVGCQDIDELRLVLLLHQLVQVALGSQEDLKLLRLSKILQRGALLHEEIQEVSSLASNYRVLLSSCGHIGLSWHRWDIEARESIAEHRAEVIKVLEAPLAFNFSDGVAADNGIWVILGQATLDCHRVTDVQFNLPVIAWLVDWLVWVLLGCLTSSHHARGSIGVSRVWLPLERRLIVVVPTVRMASNKGSIKGLGLVWLAEERTEEILSFSPPRHINRRMSGFMMTLTATIG